MPVFFFPAKKSTAGVLCFYSNTPPRSDPSYAIPRRGRRAAACLEAKTDFWCYLQATGVTGHELVSGCDDIVSGRGLNLLPD